ncbi:unnamed protein product [Ilex paraguariensis]|uniref:C2H2-type domain-containing protein n=1 Tax=Ilex paraguariensis TaxID=185542 RepID=A0ABC8QQ33_9AQUA
MDQYSQYLMWVRSKQIPNSNCQASLNSLSNSWEEQAFAEDAAGPLGGFIWPPRSYSCSFCKREFRSAQALGGHMNVHRRDRARLKQSLSPQSEVLDTQNHNQSLSKSLGTQYLHQIFTPDSNSNPSFATSPVSSSRISALSTLENFNENNTSMFPFSSSILHETPKEFPYSLPPSWSDSETVTLVSVSDSKAACEKTRRKEESVLLGHDDSVETNLTVGLNLAVSQNLSDGDETIKNKRLKRSAVSSLPLFLRSCSSNLFPFESEALGLKTSSMEDIDLELRLGDPPAKYTYKCF